MATLSLSTDQISLSSELISLASEPIPQIRMSLRKPMMKPRWATMIFSVGLMLAALLPLAAMAEQETEQAPAASEQISVPLPVRPVARTEMMAEVERQKLTLDGIESGLQREDLDDPGLADMRRNIDPLRVTLRGAIESLERALSDLDARIVQLGAAPAAGAPGEDPALTAERARLNQERAKIDGSLKQARLFMVRSDEIAAHIAERRRVLFTNTLFGQSESVLNPSFWTEGLAALPGEMRGLSMVGRSWWNYALSNAGPLTMTAAGLLLAILGSLAPLTARWSSNYRLSHAAETRFGKSLLAMATFLQIALVMPLIVIAAIWGLNILGLIPSRIMEMAFGIVMAVAMNSAGRGVAVALFAPGEGERRLLAISDETANLIAGHMTLAARILGITYLIVTVQRFMIAEMSLMVATSALFSIAIASVLADFLYRTSPRVSAENIEAGDDGDQQSQWLRALGGLLVLVIFASLAAGLIYFATFLAGRVLFAIGVFGALYIVLAFIDAFFSDALTANSAQGRALAHFFGLKPRTMELFGMLMSGLIRLVLIVIVVMPFLLGSWGIFAVDLLGTLNDIMAGIQIGDIMISPAVILNAIVILLIGILLTRWLQNWLNTRFLPRTTLDPGLQNSVSTIFGYIGFISALLLALSQVGLQFQQITIVAGALSIGIGFGLQSVVSNFVSGLILLAERPIRVGDVINIKGEEGKVQRIHVRATEIETGDNASVIIPNSELITGSVKNFTHNNTFGRVLVQVSVAYDSDIQKVRDILLEVAKENPKLVTSPAPAAVITSLANGAINCELTGVVRNLGDRKAIASDLYYGILTRFRAEGIVMPQPPTMPPA